MQPNSLIERFLDANPAMLEIFDSALLKLENDLPLTPAQRIVLNEVFTRTKARINEIELEAERYERLEPTDEWLQLQLLSQQLHKALSEALSAP